MLVQSLNARRANLWGIPVRPRGHRRASSVCTDNVPVSDEILVKVIELCVSFAIGISQLVAMRTTGFTRSDLSQLDRVRLTSSMSSGLISKSKIWAFSTMRFGLADFGMTM